MINAGLLRHNIKVYRPSSIINTYGEKEVTYEFYSNVRASVNPVTGKETWINEELKNEIDYKIQSRYTDIKVTDIIVFEDKEFDVIEILDWDMKHQELSILAKERLYLEYVII